MILDKPATRDDALALLVACAETLNDTDPAEAAFLLKLREKLVRKSARRPLTEYELGEATGREDGAKGRPTLSESVRKRYSPAFVDGYDEGFHQASAERKVAA